MDWESLTEVIDNHLLTLDRVESLTADAENPEQLGDMIRDMIREEIPENGGLADRLWTQAQQGIVYRRVGEYYWGDFRTEDDQTNEEEG